MPLDHLRAGSRRGLRERRRYRRLARSTRRRARRPPGLQHDAPAAPPGCRRDGRLRDYVNAKQVEQCSGQGGYNAYGGVQANANCTSQTMACHNQFFIKNGIVQRYTPVGSGGAICYTDSSLRPGAQSATNYR